MAQNQLVTIMKAPWKKGLLRANAVLNTDALF